MLYYISNYKPWLKTWGDYNGGLNCRLMTTTVYFFLLCRRSAFSGTKRRIQVLHLKCLIVCFLSDCVWVGLLIYSEVMSSLATSKSAQRVLRAGYMCDAIFKEMYFQTCELIIHKDNIDTEPVASWLICCTFKCLLLVFFFYPSVKKEKNKQTPASHDFNSQVLRIPM